MHDGYDQNHDEMSGSELLKTNSDTTEYKWIVCRGCTHYGGGAFDMGRSTLTCSVWVDSAPYPSGLVIIEVVMV